MSMSDVSSTSEDKSNSKFDIWNLIHRPSSADPYALTAKYRGTKTPPRRVRSGTVARRRKRHGSRTDGDSELTSRESVDLFDISKELVEEFDYDGQNKKVLMSETQTTIEPKSEESIRLPSSADDAESDRQSVLGTHAQQIYLKACKLFKVTPASYFYKHLNSERIAMKHHLLGPEGTKVIAIALVTNSSVQSLDLSDNNIGSKGAEYIADLLRENGFITDLTLAQNDIGVDGAKRIIDVVKDLDTLTKLSLSGNRFRECDAEFFKDLIEETRHLKHLNLSHNEFRERGGEIIGEALSLNDTLEILDLSWNHLRRRGADAVAEGLEPILICHMLESLIGTCRLSVVSMFSASLNLFKVQVYLTNSGLKVINLSWNGFHLDGCKSLACALESNTTLLELDLSCNRINKDCLNQLMKGLKKNTALKTLKLGWNPMTSSGAMSILAMINETKTSGITDLDLGDQLVEKSFVALLETMQKERSIQVSYGMIRGQEGESGGGDEESALVHENPVVVLMEFGKLMGFRLIDLFSVMDKDGSKSLDKDEIKQGLKFANIPLTEDALDKLIEKLDIDGDGEIDFGELMMGQQEHRKKLGKLYQATQNDEDIEETEVGRIRVKLQRLMEKKMKGNPEFRRKVEYFQSTFASRFNANSENEQRPEKKLDVLLQDPNWKEIHV